MQYHLRLTVDSWGVLSKFAIIDAENWALGHQGDGELVNKSSSLL